MNLMEQTLREALALLDGVEISAGSKNRRLMATAEAKITCVANAIAKSEQRKKEKEAAKHENDQDKRE